MPAFSGVNTRDRPPERNPKTHGHIPGVPVGTMFANRTECSKAGVHAPLQGGIHGNQECGAFSVVLSGGYEDDEDLGDTIMYTGQGGRDTSGDQMDKLQGKKKWDGPQNTNQIWKFGNKALKISSVTGRPVRVIRGHKLESRYAPREGYRYDGLYIVKEARQERGREGFLMCKFTFERLPNQKPLPGSRVRTSTILSDEQSSSDESTEDSAPSVSRSRLKYRTNPPNAGLDSSKKSRRTKKPLKMVRCGPDLIRRPRSRTPPMEERVPLNARENANQESQYAFKDYRRFSPPLPDQEPRPNFPTVDIKMTGLRKVGVRGSVGHEVERKN